MKAVTIILSLVASVATTVTSARADCTFVVGDLDLSGDNFYGPDNWDWCRQDWLDSQAGGFGMVSDSWDGHGFNDACNIRHPTGRFFTGLVALEETSPTKVWPDALDRNGNMLQWGAGWVWHVIDETKARCSSTIAECANCSFPDLGSVGDTLLDEAICQSVTGVPGFSLLLDAVGVEVCDAEAIVLTLADFEIVCGVPPFFYDQKAEERASTLVHEARHWHGKPHNAGSRDTNAEFEGAWWYEVAWLSWYAFEATPAPDGLRCDARDQANFFAATSFVDPVDPVFTAPGASCD